jgi:hypothetical protein
MGCDLMTKYTVIWDKTLERHYTETWLRSGSQMREVLTRIANWVDTELAVDPETKGEERAEIAGRVLAVPIREARVAVVYQVIPEDRQVLVTRFIFRRRR